MRDMGVGGFQRGIVLKFFVVWGVVVVSVVLGGRMEDGKRWFHGFTRTVSGEGGTIDG